MIIFLLNKNKNYNKNISNFLSVGAPICATILDDKFVCF